MRIGYALMSEEHPPHRLIENARRAERSGFAYLSISDHFHPWSEVQGNAPFAWTVIGALLEATDLPVVTQVTCPIRRYHPAIIAQAAATAAAIAPGRFTLGVGSGEALNEHVVGGAWPAPSIRLRMLEEAIEVITRLWSGELVTHEGKYFTVDRARLYTLPEEPPGLAVAASGPSSLELAARSGGLVSTGPDADAVRTYREAGGRGPVLGQPSVSFGNDREAARERFQHRWSHTAFGWPVNAELPTVEGFETAGKVVDANEAWSAQPIGDDPAEYRQSLQQYYEAGFDGVTLHAVGPNQDEFLDTVGEWIRGWSQEFDGDEPTL